jgi:NAD(P)-dependent dehydrogenase (short-subunit alcohol dehydrogenase family)
MQQGEAPRIAPGTRRELGLVNSAIAKIAARAVGGAPPNIFTTLGRHRGLFRRWLWFAGGLMPGGKLSRQDTELVILRVAHNTSSEYEWAQHERALAPPQRPARRCAADRALHADRPLRDARDDPQHASGRARLPGAVVRDLRGKRCLITGAASGIGRATAIAVAQRGGVLFLTDVQAEALDQVAGEIRAAGGTVAYAKATDVTDRDAVAAMAAEIHEAHGSMDAVMNIAGVSTWGTIEQLGQEDWRKMIEVNLMGPIGVLEAFVPAMIEARRGGHVVNVSSAAGLFGLPWHGAYGASKFGLRGVSEVLRTDLRRHGIGVSLVCPGAVRTPLVATVEIRGIDREAPVMRKLIERFERHAVSPEHVAARIIAGLQRNRYLVFTSTDIHALYLVQRYIPPLYWRVMRIMEAQLTKAGRRSQG